jgi:hypothetical protein
MKKFTITQSCPATVTHIFEVVAENQTEALNKVIDGEGDCIDIETDIHDFDAEFIIEDEELIKE